MVVDADVDLGSEFDLEDGTVFTSPFGEGEHGREGVELAGVSEEGTAWRTRERLEAFGYVRLALGYYIRYGEEDGERYQDILEERELHSWRVQSGRPLGEQIDLCRQKYDLDLGQLKAL